jgi:flavin reductase (DIM6/NTAB) family NADH-FMN oxidoreductase RutF
MAKTPFDELMADLDPAMIIVTAAADDERDGCLVGFHSQSSIRPRRYAVWISKMNRTFRIAQSATTLAVHTLAADQHDLAELFGGHTGDSTDKLAQCSWTPGPDGVPLLDEVEHRFVGRVLGTHDVQCDHVCFVLDPTDVDHPSPLAPMRLRQTIDIEPGHPA